MAFLRVSSFALVCLVIGIIIPTTLCDYQPFSAREPPIFYPQLPQVPCNSHTSHFPPPQQKPAVEYTLAIKWGPTYCNNPRYCPTRIRREFTVHGLWITHKPPRCTGQCFDFTLFGKDTDSHSFRRLTNLDRFWINAKYYNPKSITSSENNMQFWYYEYQEHGLCVNTDMLTFFRMAMHAYWSVDPQILSTAVTTLFGSNRLRRVNERIIRHRFKAILPYELAIVCTSGTYKLLEFR